MDSVRARLAFDTGQQFSAAAIAKSQRAIYAMQRFSTVRILPDKSDGETIDVHVSVSHASAHELSLGGGFGIDPATYEVRGRVGYSQIGWPLPLYRFDFDGRPAYAVLRDGSGYEPRVRALAKLSRMDLFYPFVTGEIEGGYAYEVLESYTQYGPRVRLGAVVAARHRRAQAAGRLAPRALRLPPHQLADRSDAPAAARARSDRAQRRLRRRR